MSRFGWGGGAMPLSHKQQSSSSPPAPGASHRNASVRSSYFPETEDEDDDEIEGPSRLSQTSQTSQGATRVGTTEGDLLGKLKVLEFRPPPSVLAGEGAGLQRPSYGPVAGGRESEYSSMEGQQQQGETSPILRDGPSSSMVEEQELANKQRSVFFGEIRFPVSRGVLWPRHAAGAPIFVSGLDIAPLLVLRTKPLHNLYRSLLARPSATTSTTSSSNPSTRIRAVPLRCTISSSDTLKSSPLAVAKPLVATSPPSCALILDDQPSPLQIQESTSVMEATKSLMAPFYQNTTSITPSSPNTVSMAVPAIEVASLEGGPLEDFPTLLSWYTHQVFHSPSGPAQASLMTAAAAFSPMRLLATVTAPDTLSIRAEMVVPGACLRITPLEQLPTLRTSLLVSLTETPPPKTEATEMRSGYLTLNETRKVVLLLANDPLALERPLVGVWVTGVGSTWKGQANKHPFLWATVVRYLLSDQVVERATVAPHTLLLAWIPSGQICPSPIFYECTLLPAAPSAPASKDSSPSSSPQLGCRVVDFRADICFDESLCFGTESSSGGNEWLNTILGQFRETGSSAMFLPRGRPGTTTSGGLSFANEPISALTADTPRQRTIPPRGGKEVTVVQEDQSGEQKGHQPVGGRQPEAPQVDQATYQLILAQQQHLYLLQRQVQELQALLQQQHQLQAGTTTSQPHPSPPPSIMRSSQAQAPQAPTLSSSLIVDQATRHPPITPPTKMPRGSPTSCIEENTEAKIPFKARESSSGVGLPSLKERNDKAEEVVVVDSKPPGEPDQGQHDGDSREEEEEEAEEGELLSNDIPLLAVPSLPEVAEPRGKPPPRRTDGDKDTCPPRGSPCNTKRKTSQSPSPLGRHKAQPPVRIEEPCLQDQPEEISSSGGGLEDRVMSSMQSLAVDVPHIVYSFSSDEESEGEGESVLQIEAKYLGMMGRKGVRRD